jgi:hypothetical protein
MSSNSTFQSFSTSSSSTTIDGQTTSQSHATYSDPSGTKTQSSSQQPGQAPKIERSETDNAGRRLEGGASGDNRLEGRERVQDVTEEDGDDEQKEKDRLYVERMEEEYAKREGGA